MTLICMKSRVVITIIQTHPFRKLNTEILKSERMDDLECLKVDYKEFEEMTIQHSKDLLQEGELRATSEIGRNELALNSLSRAEVEKQVSCIMHRQY